MAVAFDAVSSTSVASSGGTTLSWTHTPAGTPTAVAVSVQYFPTGAGVPTGVTYGGVAMTLAQTATASPNCTQLWGLANPPSGPKTVVVTFPSSGAYAEAGAVTVTGSDTTACFSASNQANGTNTTPTVTLSGTSSGDLMVDCCGVGGATSGPTTSQTTRWGPLNASGNYAAGSTAAIAGASITSTWTAPSGISDWELVAGAFKVASGGPAFLAAPNSPILQAVKRAAYW